MTGPEEFNELGLGLRRASTAVASSRSKYLQAQLPELLFHYTNSGGMCGILNSSRLWATNYRFLNDASEVSYAVDLFNSVVDERLAKGDGEIVAEFLRRTKATANAFDGMFDCYIACFCEHDDLLNQWRVYADAGGGYALGFHSREIGMRRGDLHPNQDFILRKVVYAPDLQRQLLAEVVDLVVDTLRESTHGRSVEEANNAIARCCQTVRTEAADYLICFKHPAFSVEQEWRLCHIVSPDEERHVLFRDGPYGLTPYVSLDPSPMAGVNADKLPLARVTHGPVTNPQNVRFALDKFLRSRGYAFTQVAGSLLPLRVGN